jgi:hypothetical protein
VSRRLLDTDILSEIIKGKNAAVAARAAAYLAEQGRFTTSAVSVAEIVYGFRRMGREDGVAQSRGPSVVAVQPGNPPSKSLPYPLLRLNRCLFRVVGFVRDRARGGAGCRRGREEDDAVLLLARPTRTESSSTYTR